RYGEPSRQVAFYRELFARLETQPGIVAAGGTSRFPLDPAYGVSEISFEGRPSPPGGPPVVGARVIGGDYFRALAIPVRSGRGFDSRDLADAPPVVLVNRAMSDRFWPGESPLEKRIGTDVPVSSWRTIVGVVGDVSHDGIDAAPVPEIYFPLDQLPGNTLNLVVRSAGGVDAATVLRRVVASLDPSLPLTELRPMQDRIRDSLAEPRFLSEAFACFAALTLFLSALALFALLAHDVERRRREIGIRLALGAQRTDVVRLFLARAARLIGAGIAIGLAGSFALAHLLLPALHGTPPDDAGALAISTAVLALVALLAAAAPSRRAARNDPIAALKQE
ncbi:MAG TPA: FtsX-like permease family protein, partial [Thermoanaerobaculia bacterium]|nr:FtsX-like permease family protein [Thermoanaerobaculia bacterium]